MKTGECNPTGRQSNAANNRDWSGALGLERRRKEGPQEAYADEAQPQVRFIAPTLIQPGLSPSFIHRLPYSYTATGVVVGGSVRNFLESLHARD